MKEMYGIEYSEPEVTLLQESGIGVSEYAARTCYDSFEQSENDIVNVLAIELNKKGTREGYTKDICNELNNIEHSKLLDDLAWTYFHHSILEHVNLSYLIRGTSRAVLQEHARHRIQAISVRSTRYTMSSVINAFVASLFVQNIEDSKDFFIAKIFEFDMFITDNKEYNKIEISGIFNKLDYQFNKLGSEEFFKLALSKDAKNNDIWKRDFSADELFDVLESCKKKRNVGDAFKHIISDNVKVDMVVTFNLRSLKNYFNLRDSGAAYFQIQWLAQKMKEVTPKKYLDLIIK